MLSSLRLRILMITLVVITLAVTINASVSYLTLQAHNEQQITRQQASIVQGNALAIEEWVAARAAMLEAARAPMIDSFPLESLKQLAQSGGFSAAFYGESNGLFLSSDGWMSPNDYDPRQRGWYQAAINQDSTIVTEPYLDIISNSLVVTFATPVKRDGRLYGVIGGDVVIDKLVSQVDAIQPTPSSFAFLSNGGETLIARPETTKTLKPISQVSETLTPEIIERLSTTPGAWEPVQVDGQTKRLSATPIAGTNWELGVALDEHEATAGLRAILYSSLITLLVIIAVTALLLSLWLKRTFASFERSRDALNDIASDEPADGRNKDAMKRPK